jgi:predicted TIM-barrel fold metal-dependent hydrolase
MSEVAINAPNLWRLETPGHAGWQRSAHADDPRKYFIVSTDSHANEPPDLWEKRIEPQYRERVPRIITDEKGVQWRYCEGYRPDRVRVMSFEGEDWLRSRAGADVQDRIRDNRRDGVDVEIIFPNKGLAMWATPDPVFANAQCRVWNDWAWEQFGPHPESMLPVASIATGDLPGAMHEIERVAKLGFRALSLPCKPIWGGHDVDHVNYNLPHFDPMWALIQETGLPITFHVSTGRDPRAARGNGGAVINYVTHSLSPTIEPVANLCASGVLERFNGLRFATIEAASAGCPGCSMRWTRRIASITCGSARSCRACPATTTAPMATRRSRRIPPASRWPRPGGSWTISCGPATTRITRAPGRTRLRRSSARCRS